MATSYMNFLNVVLSSVVISDEKRATNYKNMLASSLEQLDSCYLVTTINGKRYVADKLTFELDDSTLDEKTAFDGKNIGYLEFKELEDGKTIDDGFEE